MGIWLNRAIIAAQNVARQNGVTFLKNSRYDEEWGLSGALLAEAANAERDKRGLKTDKPGKAGWCTGVVFSFNRPVQLHLLLASYYRMAKAPAPLVVQYGAKGEAFEAAYKDVAALFPQVEFVREKGFKDTLQGVLAGIATPRVFFLVDDIVFTRRLDMAEFGALNPLECIGCLRLAPTLSYSYTSQVAQKAPPFRSFGKGELLAFDWEVEANEWSYPMSVDGNLFDTAEITVMSRISAYKAPNSYEGALMRFAPVMKRRPGVCYAQPRLMNVPCNKVQDEVANVAGDVSPEFLLAQWHEGLAIDPAPFENYANRGPHEEVTFRFVAREGKKTAVKKNKAA